MAADPAKKGEALALLLQGHSLDHVASRTRVPKSTLKRWRDAAKSGTHPQVQNEPNLARNGTESGTKKTYGELVDENLRKSFEMQTAVMDAIIRAAADPTWLFRQDIDSIGTMLGISHDKAIRVFEAVERSRSQSKPRSGGE